MIIIMCDINEQTYVPGTCPDSPYLQSTRENIPKL